MQQSHQPDAEAGQSGAGIPSSAMLVRWPMAKPEKITTTASSEPL